MTEIINVPPVASDSSVAAAATAEHSMSPTGNCGQAVTAAIAVRAAATAAAAAAADRHRGQCRVQLSAIRW
jgi:hypothetical protein